MSEAKIVVSLFDGIGTIWQSLKELNISISEAYSYEIDKYAMQICQKNHPEVKHMGSVVGADFSIHKGAELVVGGFPCTDLSIAKKDRKGLQGEHSSLFWELVRAINEIQPKYFLVENNASMPKADKEVITKTLGVEPIMINSALVSAQSRKRLYWTNIPDIQQPEDRGILLADILNGATCNRDKSYCITATYANAGNLKDYFEHGKRQLVMEPVITQRSRGYNKGGVKKEKCPTLTASSFEHNNHIAIPICVNSKSGRGNNLTAQPSLQDRIYNVNGKMVAITTSHRPNIAQPVRLGNLGEEEHNKQGYRVYSIVGKSVCLSANGSGVGGKTGLYKIDLPDGDYIIRKLTPIECERLQTLPDGYTEGISNTQRYKCLGNGWTNEVIKHILSYL